MINLNFIRRELSLNVSIQFLIIKTCTFNSNKINKKELNKLSVIFFVRDHSSDGGRRANKIGNGNGNGIIICIKNINIYVRNLELKEFLRS